VDTTCVEENWVAQNQWQDFPLSMNMGVRAFVFSLGVFEDQPHVCHGDCKWGRRPLKVVFQQLYSFLTSNLREVITLVLENNPAHGAVLQAEIEGLVVQAGLGSFINVSVLDSFGTGLGTLIEEKARLVIFADFKEDSVNILSSQRYVSAVPLDCAASGAVSSDAPFVLVRQYADDAARLGSSPHVSAVLATKPRIQACQQACAERLGRRPNFLVNDFVTAEGLMMGRSTASTAIRSCVSNAGACAAGKFKAATGAAACEDCPDNSGTGTDIGTVAQSSCLANAGYTGSGSSVSACAANTYKAAGTSSAGCTSCPLNSSTAGSSASAAVSACVANAGYTGPDGGDFTACGPGLTPSRLTLVLLPALDVRTTLLLMGQQQLLQSAFVCQMYHNLIMQVTEVFI
jgi:hypothetical protein